MNPNAAHVLTAALDLPDDDRLELVEALLDSFRSTDAPPFDDSWHEIIRRRSAELKSGSAQSIPWAEAKRQAREAVGG